MEKILDNVINLKTTVNGKTVSDLNTQLDEIKSSYESLDEDLRQQFKIRCGSLTKSIESSSEQLVKFNLAISDIKEKNRAIFNIDDATQFVQFIKKNMREQPEVYAKIRQVNAGRLEVDLAEQNIMDLGKNECAASMAAA